VTKRIVIIDDSLTIRMDLKELFESAGFEAVACATAEQGRRELAARRFDLIVLDVLLPDADGVELLAEFRAGGAAAVPVIVLSTEDQIEDRVRGLKTGAHDYIGKPYDRSYLLVRAQQLVAATDGDPTDGTRASATILVIDDSVTFRQELGAQLERAGYRAVLAADGNEGLRKAAELHPDAAIVDGVLPDIDGATVVRRLRLDPGLRGTPCLLLTAEEDAAGEIAALDAGADAFARKSEDESVILARVAAMLRTAGEPRDHARRTSLAELKKVLAVDDSPTYLEELAQELRDEGYDVVKARSGEEALELLTIQPVDAILLDLVMPGLSGTDVCRRVKAAPALRYVPLIMLTAVSEREAMIQGINAGADDYVTKSPDFEPLRARLRAQLRRKQFEDENRRMRDQLFAKESEARQAHAIAAATQVLSQQLEQQNATLASLNRDLQMFASSVSHDLRQPLRAVAGFTKMLADSCRDKLDEKETRYLDGARAAAARMGELIEGLLTLSRVSRSELALKTFRLDALATKVAANLRVAEPQRVVEFVAASPLDVEADPKLLGSVLENLLGNAWKFTSRCEHARIEIGVTETAAARAYFVRDNGAGFDMRYAKNLFSPFQRLHTEEEFPGTGIGLATVQRIIARHRGRIWAESAPGQGACFYFTLWDQGGAPQSVDDVERAVG
jgi:two-component system, NtrC family, sensor kinase